MIKDVFLLFSCYVFKKKERQEKKNNDEQFFNSYEDSHNFVNSEQKRLRLYHEFMACILIRVWQLVVQKHVRSRTELALALLSTAHDMQ